MYDRAATETHGLKEKVVERGVTATLNLHLQEKGRRKRERERERERESMKHNDNGVGPVKG